MVAAMKKRLSLALGGALALSSSAAFAQAVQAQGTAGFPPAGPQYQPAPAYYPPPKTIENIGRTGQFIFGIERITGLFLDRQTITYRNPATGARLQTASILGYSPHTAARFYGLGNSAFAVLASPAAAPR